MDAQPDPQARPKVPSDSAEASTSGRTLEYRQVRALDIKDGKRGPLSVANG